MRAPAKLHLILAAMSAMAGCHGPDLAPFAARPDAVQARQITDALSLGDVAAVTAQLDESLRTPDPETTLKPLVQQFPSGAPLEVRLVGYQFNIKKVVGGATTAISNVTFESRYDRSYVVTNVVLRRVGDGAPRVVGLHVQALPEPLEALNAFSLAGKGPIQYAFLLAMIAVAVTTVAALVLWFRRGRITKHRWWWLLAIVVGAFKVSVSWATGAVVVQELTIQFFSLSAMRDGLAGPWILSFSIPAGAIAFLINARQRKDPGREPHFTS
jgi:hypothetical protein